jgi:hypothetical protein
VSLETLEPRATAIGDEAARKARDHILTRAHPPAGVQVQAIDGGIALTGKRLRRRMITDPQLRNFAR